MLHVITAHSQGPFAAPAHRRDEPDTAGAQHVVAMLADDGAYLADCRLSAFRLFSRTSCRQVEVMLAMLIQMHGRGPPGAAHWNQHIE